MLETKSLFAKLPFAIIREILLYDDHFVIRKQHNRLSCICINKLSKIDIRYLLLTKIPRIYELSTNSWSVILGKNKKFVIGHYLRPSNIWEYRFATFSIDPHTNMTGYIPDSAIYIPL
jgi:hypothetical protein